MSTESKKANGETVEKAVPADEPVIESPEVAQEPAAGDQASEQTPEQLIAELQAELEAARTKADEHWDRLLRNQAELENVRKRAARDVDNARKYALEGIASELLPVRDSLELGLSSIQQEGADIQSARDGLQLIQQMLAKLMDQYGIKPVDPAGEVFNPDLHQAMSMQETSEQAANTVLTVMQKGYTLNDRLLRPAMVVVAKAPEAAKEASAEQPEKSEDGA